MSIVADFCPADLSAYEKEQAELKKKFHFPDRLARSLKLREELEASLPVELSGIEDAIAAEAELFPPVDLYLEDGSFLFSDTPVRKSHTLFSFLKEKAGEQWEMIFGGRFHEAAPLQPGESPKQKPKRIERSMTFTDGVNLHQADQLREEARCFLSGDHRRYGYTPEDIGTIMAIANILVFFRADAFGCFEWEDSISTARSDRHIAEADRSAVLKMVDAVVSQQTALTAICKILEEHWAPLHVRTRRATVRRLLVELGEFGYLSFYSDCVKGERGQPMVFTMLNVPALLALHEQAEVKIWESFDASATATVGGAYQYGSIMGSDGRHMPAHMGNSARVLFNALFVGTLYNREHYENPPMSTEDAIDQKWEVERRRRATIAAQFIRLDVEFGASRDRLGESSPKTSFLRRQWNSFLERFPWLTQVLKDHRYQVDKFAHIPAWEVAGINEIWERRWDEWCSSSGQFVDAGDRRWSVEEFLKGAFDYAMEYPQVLGRMKFERYYGKAQIA
jgi:hypothetical protein